MTVEQKLRRAFDYIYDQLPYLASIVASWQVSARPDLTPTAATNGPSMIYNPAFIDSLSIQDTSFLVLHEAGHIFMGHHLRGEGLDARRWNIAADLALNCRIQNYMSKASELRESMLLPGQGNYANLPPDQDAEFYYANLPSGAGGNSSTSESDCTGAPGEVLPHPAEPGSMEHEMAVQQWKQQIAHSVIASDKCGSLPGWVQEIAGLVFGESTLNWRVLLRQFLTKKARSRYSYTRPNRRHLSRSTVILPSRRSREASDGCVLVDTSGSMREGECNVALREIEAILSCFGNCEITLMQSDTRLITEATRTFKRADFPMRVPQQWWGRGGTDLSPALREISNLKEKYGYLIVLSDMEWAVSSVPNPGVPTLWLSTRYSESALGIGRKPTFGQVIGPVK